MRAEIRMAMWMALAIACAGDRSQARANALAPGVSIFPAAALIPDSTNGWGYGYDSLLKDLALWKESPYMRIDSIGASVEGRALWMVTITEGEGPPGGSKRRVFIHARTHPAEVQANYIAKEAIAFLLDSGSLSAEIRRHHVFNIIPMYNPDGVEKSPGRDHGYGRLNANRVDLESNWDKPNIQPEVQALRARFDAFMAGPNPVEVALNLHSDQFNCTRFFFFHVNLPITLSSTSYAI